METLEKDLKASLQASFIERFDSPADYLYFSPGRINLIGEHTDYNGGHVFPAAISIGTYGALTLRDDQEILVFSANFPDVGVVSFNLNDLAPRKYDSWVKYVRGVLYELKRAGYRVERGFNLGIVGDMPNASGLSSSASLELLIGEMLNAAFKLHIARLDIVKLGQQVENDYLGLRTGIMDQFAIGFGEKEKAIFLDVNTMDYELVPAEFGEYELIIMTTNKKRELVDSKYNERRDETELALKELQTVLPNLASLGELDLATFEKYQDAITDSTVLRRARHAVSENERTIIATSALKAHDLVKFGELLQQSHESLRDDYEVTGEELDTLFDAAMQQPGVLGARMTGAGFGGSAIALVPRATASDFIKNVGELYQAKIGYPASFYLAEIVRGTAEL